MGQADMAGISQPGKDRFKVLKDEAKAGRTPQGLVIEKLVLTKLRADKGIQGLTYEAERARRRGNGVARPVAVAPPMADADVEAEFED